MKKKHFTFLVVAILSTIYIEGSSEKAKKRVAFSLYHPTRTRSESLPIPNTNQTYKKVDTTTLEEYRKIHWEIFRNGRRTPVFEQNSSITKSPIKKDDDLQFAMDDI
jgi:hypothetical protein